MKLRGYKAAASFARRALPPLACDVSGLCGCGLIIYGAWRIYEPAGFVVAGAMLLIGAWFFARRG